MAYEAPEAQLWRGRVDDPADEEALRWHQIVEAWDLRQPPPPGVADDGVKLGFIGFCSDEGIRRNLGRAGAVRGPASIRTELADLPWLFGGGKHLLDAGNIHCEDGNLEAAQNELAEAVRTLLSLGVHPVVLGGGHELAFGHYMGIEAFARETAGTRLGIVNLDAHFDLRPYGKGTHSGSAFAQIADRCRDRGVGFEYACLGVQRSANTLSLFRKAEQLGVRHVLGRDLNELGPEVAFAVLEDLTEKVDCIYFTICADVFSSAFAPGVSAPQPLGLHPETVLTLARRVIRSGKVVSLDVAEVSPRFDQDNRTANLAAITLFAAVNTLLGLKASYF